MKNKRIILFILFVLNWSMCFANSHFKNTNLHAQVELVGMTVNKIVSGPGSIDGVDGFSNPGLNLAFFVTFKHRRILKLLKTNSAIQALVDDQGYDLLAQGKKIWRRFLLENHHYYSNMIYNGWQFNESILRNHHTYVVRFNSLAIPHSGAMHCHFRGQLAFALSSPKVNTVQFQKVNLNQQSYFLINGTKVYFKKIGSGTNMDQAFTDYAMVKPKSFYIGSMTVVINGARHHFEGNSLQLPDNAEDYTLIVNYYPKPDVVVVPIDQRLSIGL